MPPEAHIAHRTAHRLRIRIPAKKGDADYFSGLRAVLLEGGRAEHVEVNPLTASVLIVSPGGVDEFADPAAWGEWYTLRPSTPKARPLSSRVVQGFRAVDARIEEMTGGELDIPSVALLGLICSGIYQISIGNFAAPAWYTAFWYAASIAAKTDNPDKPGGFM